jgi:hypothetical protein
MWRVELEPDAQLLTIAARKRLVAADVRELALAHAGALAATGGGPFRLLVDLRGLAPLDPDAVALFGELKRAAAAREGCQGVIVLADSATVAMQQRRTCVPNELVTEDPVEALGHLRR